MRFDATWFGTYEKFPSRLALTNEIVPLTKDTVDAFIEAYPDMVTKPRSTVMASAYHNPKRLGLKVSRLFFKTNSHLCGPDRTRAFSKDGVPNPTTRTPWHVLLLCPRYGGYQVDWEALENHLKQHPIEKQR
jgi:hypothetical protein